MKKLLLLIPAMLFMCCNGKELDSKEMGYRISGYEKSLKLVEIDSCEYIIAPTVYGCGITHKGNCKYCEERHGRH